MINVYKIVMLVDAQDTSGFVLQEWVEGWDSWSYEIRPEEVGHTHMSAFCIIISLST